jgi:L-threonylcarbamoyladenylate synthase
VAVAIGTVNVSLNLAPIKIATRTMPADEAGIAEAARIIAAGGLVAFPTETVYGLGGDATSDRAVAAIFAAKGRPSFNPLIVHVPNIASAAQHAELSAKAQTAARAFWPGPLTLVLRGGEGRLPDMLRGPEGGIAVRHTSHRAVARLIGQIGRPLTSTSANVPGMPPASGPEQLIALFREAYDKEELLVLDGGALGNVPPSTIVDCTGPQPALIREGALPRGELRARAGRWAP